MSDRKLYWHERLGTERLRKGWWDDLEALGLLSPLVSFDSTGTLDKDRTIQLAFRREPAVEQLVEALRLAHDLVWQTWIENVAPVKRDKEKNEDGNAAS